MTSITEMNEQQAKEYLLTSNSYCSIDLPPYFDFTDLIRSVCNHLDTNNNLKIKKANDFEGTSYTLLSCKNNSHNWRPLELIHPALYTNLVLKLTEANNWNAILSRMAELRRDSKIVCASIPRSTCTSSSNHNAEAIKAWLRDVEEQSIIKSLEYRYLLETDIANFYPSIYTHSIPWAIHTKPVAKDRSNWKNDLLVGNQIDWHIQAMHHGQTNGIPQGSVLMDFIAEILLAYIDCELTKKINSVNEYHIIRFRDDYRIFTNSKEDSEKISRALAIVLQELGLQLNSAKTTFSSDPLLSSIKEDKRRALRFFEDHQKIENLKNSFLAILAFSREFPNSGQIKTELMKIDKVIQTVNRTNLKCEPLISIITDIMLTNPSAHTQCALVMSKLLSHTEPAFKASIIGKVREKLSSLLNTGLLDIWLQRITLLVDPQFTYEEDLCKKITSDKQMSLWESGWITDPTLIATLQNTAIFNQQKFEECKEEINSDEVSIYPYITEDTELF